MDGFKAFKPKRENTSARDTIKKLAKDGNTQSVHGKKFEKKFSQERKGPPELQKSNLPSAAQKQIKQSNFMDGERFKSKDQYPSKKTKTFSIKKAQCLCTIPLNILITKFICIDDMEKDILFRSGNVVLTSFLMKHLERSWNQKKKLCWCFFSYQPTASDAPLVPPPNWIAFTPCLMSYSQLDQCCA